MKEKILHVMVSEKFMPPFIDYVSKHFDKNEHHFVFITSPKYEYGLTKAHDIEFLYTDDDIFKTLKSYMYSATKIILHGLWRDKINKLLRENEALLKKSYWIMWGGDFYFPNPADINRAFVIKNINFLVTRFTYDIEYIKIHYGAKGNHLDVLPYECSYVKDRINSIQTPTKRKNILVGNSAAPTNNHIEILKKLTPFSSQDIAIYVPLSYGSCAHALKVMKFGYENFYDKFKPMIDFLDLDEYYSFLSTIDIAFFNHHRQQGFGNIITLIEGGKKVYLRHDNSVYKLLNKSGITAYDIDGKINLEHIDESTKKENILSANRYFSKKVLFDGLSLLFGHAKVSNESK